MINKNDKRMSMRKQCELLGINRASLYYAQKDESSYNLDLMTLIDEQFTECPEMGVQSMVAYLTMDKHKKCGQKRVRRLMRKMGLEPIYPKPKTSKPNKAHKVYPYRVNHFFCVNSIYIHSVGNRSSKIIAN